MTRTCQLLVEGDYGEVFRPGIDYIEIKNDFSNIAEVIERVKDVEYCKEIADNCYKHVVESGKYTYSGFVKKVMDVIKEDKGNTEEKSLNELCDLSQKIPSFNARVFMKAGKLLGLKKTFWLMLKSIQIPRIIKFLLKPIKNTKLYEHFLNLYRKM